MNTSSFDQMLRQVLVVPVLAILLGAGALVWQIRQANLTVGNIELSDARIAETLLIERLIVDQETGLRGYETTRDTRFLEPFYSAGKQIPIELKRRADMATTAERRQVILDLEQEHQTWEDAFALPMIASIAAGASTSDVDLNLQGKREMDDMRQRLANLSSYTEQRRLEYEQHWHSQVRHTIIALVVFALLIGLIIGLYTRRLLQDVSAAFRESHNVLRIRAEQTFRSEQKLRTTLQSIGDGVITCDSQGLVQTMNQVASDLTGWLEAEAQNKPLTQVFNILDASTRQPTENPVSRVKLLNSVANFGNHTILVRKDGSELFIDESGAPMRDKYGKLIGVVLVFRDVTLAKKSQEALLANEKLAVAGRLAATIAHEIHNPLDSVSNLLFLMDGRSSPEESQHFLQLAKQEIARVTQISRAMLSLYRESRAPVPIDLKQMLQSILLLMDSRFHMLGVSIDSRLPDDLVIHGFPAELRQVFTNLLTNAAEASGSGGIVHLTATPCSAHVDSTGQRHAEGVQVAIEDQGPGIPEDVRSSLFQPFFTTKGERGTGLGLWVSRGIITKHGGAIDLASTTDPAHHGTTVSVFLATNPHINAGGE